MWHYGVKKNAYGVLVWKPEGMKPPVRLRYRWMYNIKLDLTGDTDGR